MLNYEKMWKNLKMSVDFAVQFPVDEQHKEKSKWVLECMEIAEKEANNSEEYQFITTKEE